ncbi:MAG: hypothetical protein KQJ78_07855 [Deltaproteobacteria bacterium]|nr:hypothetical protein [Deltaproteobacteria bacterium]MCB2186316.1 hypothetical protein [Deltaproteobacteria bacterium]
MPRHAVVVPAFLLVSCLLAACAGGMIANQGYHERDLYQGGRPLAEVFEATRQGLAEVGVVGRSEPALGLVEGWIAPYQVRATITPGSKFEKLVVEDDAKGMWKRTAGPGQWRLVWHGREYQRPGAESLEEAMDEWRDAIMRNLPSQ